MGESLFPSNKQRQRFECAARPNGRPWMGEGCYSHQHIGLVMNIPIYIGKRYETDSASCKHDQNRSMSVGSRKAVRRGLGFNIKVLAYCGAEPQALKKLEKCEKSG